jgi:isocitrate lyase
MSDRAAQQYRINTEWNTQPRWRGIQRPYSAADVVRLRGTVQIEHSLARLGAEKFWKLLHSEPVVGGLGCVTGNQAIQAVQSGLKAIYCSGWQVAGDGNSAGEMYPDQSLYPVDSVPKMIERINNALLRTDQIHALDDDAGIDWLAPIIADAEAGFGGNLNAFELTKAMIRAGAAGVHFEDQLSSAKKCGHMGGKVLVPTDEAINKLVAARLAADVSGVPTLRDRPHRCGSGESSDLRSRSRATSRSHGQAQPRRVFPREERHRPGDRPGPSYAPYADLIWCETAKPDMEKRAARARHPRKIPRQTTAYNCSPSSTGRRN